MYASFRKSLWFLLGKDLDASFLILVEQLGHVMYCHAPAGCHVCSQNSLETRLGTYQMTCQKISKSDSFPPMLWYVIHVGVKCRSKARSWPLPSFLRGGDHKVGRSDRYLILAGNAEFLEKNFKGRFQVKRRWGDSIRGNGVQLELL